MPRRGSSSCAGTGSTSTSTDILARTTGRTGVECMRELLGAHLSDDAVPGAGAREGSTSTARCSTPTSPKWRAFGAFARAAVARGLKIAVGTAGDRHNIAFAMSRLKMDPLPLAIVGGDEGFCRQAEPAIFLEAARRIGVAPERCIVFEDAPFGIEAARRGGMRAVAVCSTHSRRRTRRAARDGGRARLRRTRPLEFSGDARCCNCVMHKASPSPSGARTTPPPPSGSTPST